MNHFLLSVIVASSLTDHMTSKIFLSPYLSKGLQPLDLANRYTFRGWDYQPLSHSGCDHKATWSRDLITWTKVTEFGQPLHLLKRCDRDLLQVLLILSPCGNVTLAICCTTIYRKATVTKYRQHLYLLKWSALTLLFTLTLTCHHNMVMWY